jgi:hypothetical protein
MTAQIMLTFILLLQGLICSDLSYGLGSEGPSISAAGTTSSNVEPVEADPKFDLSLRINKQLVEATMPVAEQLGGKWYLKFRQDHESRSYSGTSAATDFTAKYTELGTNYFGAIYATEAWIPKTKVYLIAGRFGLRTFKRDVRPMGEYFGILSFKLADYGLNLFPGKNDRTTLVLKVKNWNYGTKYTPIFLQTVSLGDGFTLDIGVISHVKLNWHSPDDAWGVYLNGEGNSQQTPIRDNGEIIWVNGHVIDGYMGIRSHIQSIFYIAAEGGMHQDNSIYNDKDGKVLREQVSEFAPWVRIRLETFVP